MDLDRIDDVETLRAIAKGYEANWLKAEARLKRLEAKLAKLDDSQQELALSKEIDELKRQLATRNRILFGKKSEKRGHGKKNPKKARQTGHGPTEQTELPVVDQTHELDDPDRMCPSCGGALEEWAGQSEDAEEIGVVELRFVRVNHRRKKYRCKCGGCVETAPGPKKLIPGGRYSTGFAVHTAVAKYADHLPLERQVRMMRRAGLQVTSQSLWDQVHALAKALAGAHKRQLLYLQSKAVLGADETHWRVMNKSGAKRWQVWGLAAEDAVAYRIEDSRSADKAEEIFGDFCGTAITDGYAAYGAMKKRRPTMKLAHCWAHVRRKFVELEDLHPGEVGPVLDLIAELYDVEREARAGPDLLESRRRLREAKSRKVIRDIQAWALKVEALGESPLRKAVEYMGKLWPGLVLFLDDPEVAVDNNAVERSLRGIVVGRKNHYGSKSRRGTEAAAILYTFVESAKLIGLDPAEYLQRAADAAIDGVEVPLPHEIVVES